MAVVVVAGSIAGPAVGQSRFPGDEWNMAPSPTAVGWDTAALERARVYSDSIGSTAVMVIQDGVVVAQWGDVTTPTDVYSVRKSLLSALIGIAVRDRQLDTTARWPSWGSMMTGSR